MKLLRRHARQAARVVREAAGFTRPGQTYRIRPNRERWRAHDARIVATIDRAQHRGELP